MKRSPLRRDPERTREWQNRSRVPLRRSRRTLDDGGRVAAAAFHRAAQGRPCVICGRLHREMEAHHAIEADFLRRTWPEFVYDPRNAVPVCPWWAVDGCDGHGDHTSAMRRMPRDRLPASVGVFADELGLGWYIARYYPAASGRRREGPGGDAS